MNSFSIAQVDNSASNNYHAPDTPLIYETHAGFLSVIDGRNHPGADRGNTASQLEDFNDPFGGANKINRSSMLHDLISRHD